MPLLHEAPLSPFFAAMTTRIFLYLGDDATVADSVLLTEVTVDGDASSLVRVRSRVGFEQPMAMASSKSKVRYRMRDSSDRLWSIGVGKPITGIGLWGSSPWCATGVFRSLI